GSRTLMDRKDRSAIILEPVFLLRPETVMVYFSSSIQRPVVGSTSEKFACMVNRSMWAAGAIDLTPAATTVRFDWSRRASMDGRDVVTFSVKRRSILSETELLLTTTVIEVAFAMAGRVAAKSMVEIAAIRMRRSGLEVNVGNWPSMILGRTWRYTL